MASRGTEYRVDIAVVGAGIVGLATTLALVKRDPRARVVVLDKEREVAAHQTGHNSGVIHSGIYYKPGSLKAQLCVSGAQQLKQFCAEHDIHFAECGKLIVATEPDELPRLQALHERAQANGVLDVTRLTPDELRAAAPHVRIATVSGVDHFFVGKRDEVGALVAADLARVLPVPSHLP